MCLWEDTFTRNTRFCGSFNRPCEELISAVDVVTKQRCVKQTMESVWDHGAKSISSVGGDMKFANNFMISHLFWRSSAVL